MSSYKLDLQGQTLVVAAAENSPHVLKNFLGHSDISNFGYEMRILHELSKKFNFTVELINTLANTGIMLKNGTWSGLMGHIVDNRADIGFGGLTRTHDREKVVDFLYPPHFSSAITFITTWPKTTESITTLIIDPYIILCLLISMIGIMIMIKFIVNYHDSLKNYPLYWTIFAIAVHQDINYKMIKNDSLRILIYTWQFAIMAISLYLGCLIYQAFSSPKHMNTINTLFELSEAMKSKSIDVLINENSARYTELKILQKTNQGIIKEIYSRLKFLKQGQKGTKTVRNSNVALGYIDYRLKFEYELYKIDENTYHIPPNDPDSVFRNAYFAFAVKKNFKYKKFFGKHVKNMVTTGFIEHWLRKQKFNEGFVYHNEGKKTSVNNEDEQGTIVKTFTYVAAFGFSLSILVFLVEVGYHFYWKRQTKI